MKISIINADGTTTYIDHMTPVATTEDFSESLNSATEALNDAQATSNSAATMNATDSASVVTSTTASVPADLMSIFQEAAQTYGVDVNLLTAIARQESNFTATATSSSGAMGIMQLMPATAQGLGVNDAYNPYENIMGGAKYISQLLSRYNGDISLALAAYNAGSGNVAKYGGIPPFAETQNYVSKVLGYYQDSTANGTVTGSNHATSTGTVTANNASATNSSRLSETERQNIYRQMLSLTNQLILDRLESS